MSPMQHSPERLERMRRAMEGRKAALTPSKQQLEPPAAYRGKLATAGRYGQVGTQAALEGAYMGYAGALPSLMGLLGLGMEQLGLEGPGWSAPLLKSIADESEDPDVLTGETRIGQYGLLGPSVYPAGVSPTLMDVDIESLGQLGVSPLGREMQQVAALPLSALSAVIGGDPRTAGEKVFADVVRGASMGAGMAFDSRLTDPAAAMSMRDAMLAGAAGGALGGLATDLDAPWWLRMVAEVLPFAGVSHGGVGGLSLELQQRTENARRRFATAAGMAEESAALRQAEAAAEQAATDLLRGRVYAVATDEATPSSSLVLMEQEQALLQQAGLTAEARATGQAAEALREGGIVRARSLRDRVAEQYGLVALPGHPAVEPLETARELRGRVQQARRAAYEPLQQRYEAWDSQYGNVSIVIDAGEAQELSKLASEMARSMRTSAERTTDDVLRGMLMEDAAEAGRLAQVMQSVAEGAGAFPINASVLRDASTSLRRIVGEALAGDPKRQYNLLRGRIDRMLQQHPSAGAYQELKTLNADYGVFKRRFEGNRLMRPLLSDYVPVESALDGLRTAEAAQILSQVLDAEGTTNLVRYRLEPIMRMNPQEALNALRNDRVLQRLLPREQFQEIVQALTAETSQSSVKSLVSALNTVERALENPELRDVGRQSLERTREMLRSQIEASGQPQVAQARRELEATAARREQSLLDVAQAESTLATFNELTTLLKRDVPLSDLSPDKVADLLTKAERLGPTASANFREALLGHILDTGNPVEFANRLVAFRPQIGSLIGAENASLFAQAWPRVATAIDRLSRDAVQNILQTVSEKASTRQTRQWAQLLFKGPRSYLYASILQSVLGSLLNMSAKGRPLRRILNALDPSRPVRIRKTIISILSNKSTVPFLRDVRDPEPETPKKPFRGAALSPERESRLREAIRKRSAR